MAKSLSSTVVLGLDLSLRAAAAIVITDSFYKHLDWDELPTIVVGHGLTKEATEAERLDRIIHIAETIEVFASKHYVSHVFVEHYAYSMNGVSQAHSLGELGGVVKAHLHRNGYPVQPVIASQARKFAFGKIPRKDAKIYVGQKVNAMGGNFKTADEVDAWVVGNFGRSELDLPAIASND